MMVSMKMLIEYVKNVHINVLNVQLKMSVQSVRTLPTEPPHFVTVLMVTTIQVKKIVSNVMSNVQLVKILQITVLPVPLQDKLVPHLTVHAQLDKLILMKFVMLVVTNVPLVMEQSTHVSNVLPNPTEQKSPKKPPLVNASLDSTTMDTVHTVMLV